MDTRDKPPIDWYRTPIDKQVLRDLNTRSDARAFLQVGGHLLFAVALGAAAYYAHLRWAWWITALLLYAYWTVASFLGITAAGHELSHGTVFRTPFWNTFFTRLVGFLTWSNLVQFHASHLWHHRLTCHTGRDLEVVLPVKLPKASWFYAFAMHPLALPRAIRGHWRISRGVIENEWERWIFPEANPELRRQRRLWSAAILTGHLGLAVVFVLTGQWFLFLLITVAPYCAGWLIMLCGFPQHAGLVPSVPDFRLCCRTMRLNALCRFLYWNMNYHAEHHMYPGVPCYNLPRLRATIEHDMPPAHGGLLPAWREILGILKRQKAEPGYVYMQPLPATAAPAPAAGIAVRP